MTPSPTTYTCPLCATSFASPGIVLARYCPQCNVFESSISLAALEQRRASLEAELLRLLFLYDLLTKPGFPELVRAYAGAASDAEGVNDNKGSEGC